MRAFRLLLLTGLVSLLTACGSAVRTLNDQAPASPTLLGQTSELPLPLDRKIAGLTELELLGKDAVLTSPHAVPVGTTMVLDGVGHSAQYAIYAFHPTAEAPDSVSFLMEHAVTTSAFVGLANFSTNRWEFSGPFDSQKTLAMDEQKYLSPDGNILISILTPHGELATLNALSIRTLRPDNQPPTAALDTDVTTGNTPLTVNFDASASSDSDGEIIEYAWDFDGDGLYDGFTDTSTTSHTYTAPGSFSATVRVTDDQLARDTASVALTITTAGNAVPGGTFSASPLVGDPPQVIDFDASGVTDSDGSIVRYEWDWEADGVYDGYGETPIVSHYYTMPGPHRVRLRVTDNLGSQTVLNLAQPIVLHGWANSADPDRPGDVGSYCSTCVIGGKPSIAYFDGSNQSLKFVQALDADGSQWGTPMTIDGSPTVHCGMFCSLSGGGSISIAYYDSTNGDLKYRYCNDPTGTDWYLPLVLDSTGDVGQYLSTLRASGQAISYYDATNGHLKFIRSNDNFGTEWEPAVVVDSSSGVGNDTDLGYIHGRYAISYGTSSGSLKYVRASSFDATTWGTPIVLDARGTVGVQSSLEEINSQPAVVYIDYDVAGGLKYVRANDTDGISWPAPTLIDPRPNAGFYPSLHVLSYSYFPAVSYYNYATGDLDYLSALDMDGTTWGTPQTLDAAGDVGWYSSTAVPMNGTPGIAYYDYSNTSLKYIKLY